MVGLNIEVMATNENLDEQAYLLANPDVANAIKAGQQKSARSHYEIFGKHEGRKIRYSAFRSFSKPRSKSWRGLSRYFEPTCPVERRRLFMTS